MSFLWLGREKSTPLFVQLDRIPLYGNAPRFDIPQLSTLIASHFGRPPCQWSWATVPGAQAGKIKEGLGSNVVSLGIARDAAGRRSDLAHGPRRCSPSHFLADEWQNPRRRDQLGNFAGRILSLSGDRGARCFAGSGAAQKLFA